MTSPALPAGPFRLLYADPPWRFEPRARASGLGRAPERHYQTLTATELAALPVAEIAAGHALLAMWVYDPMLEAALDLGRAWGFRFVTVLFHWIKTTDKGLALGTGYHTRGGGSEACWLFARGAGLPVRRHDVRREFFAPRREHSRKPDQVADWLVALYGDVPRLELFARTRRPGWQAWGLEPDRFPAEGAP